MRIYTKAELEADLKQLEISWDMCDITERYYLQRKQFLTDSLIDLETGPTKRRLRAMLEPHKNRIKPSDWNGFLVKLTHCRSIAEIKALHNHWKGRLEFKLIATLPDLNAAAAFSRITCPVWLIPAPFYLQPTSLLHLASFPR